jgi:hypothetical protein
MEWPSNSAFRLQIAIFAERELDFDTPQAGGLAAVGVIIAAYSSRQPFGMASRGHGERLGKHRGVYRCGVRKLGFACKANVL